MIRILFILSLILKISMTNAQTINPSCFSNADGWKVTKVENALDGTNDYLDYYSYKKDYTFWISSGIYIEDYHKKSSSKYYAISILNNEFDMKYRLEPFTSYEFVIKFERIASYWTNINIKEPYIEGNNSWYWN